MSDGFDGFGRARRWLRCSTCCATGWVENPYCLAVASELEVQWAPEGAIRVTPVGTVSIFEVCREAAELATSRGRRVAFSFTGHADSEYAVSHVIINPGDDPDQRARDWWIGAYGETPEQTRSRR